MGSALLSLSLGLQSGRAVQVGPRVGGGGDGWGCVAARLMEGCLALLYRLVLTLIPRCGPQASPQAWPPFLEENRKLWLYLLHAL